MNRKAPAVRREEGKGEIVPQGLEYTILYHSSSFEQQAGKCYAETVENNDISFSIFVRLATDMII